MKSKYFHLISGVSLILGPTSSVFLPLFLCAFQLEKMSSISQLVVYVYKPHFHVQGTSPPFESSQMAESTSRCCWVTKSCPTLCNPMHCGRPGFPVLHDLQELVQTHVHWVGDAIEPSHLLLPPSPPALHLSNLSLKRWKRMGPCFPRKCGS